MMTSSNEIKHQTHNPLLRMALRRFFTAVQAILPSDVYTVLDAGCGEGYAAAALHEMRSDLKIYGVDLSEQALRRARTIHPMLPTSVADVTRLPVRDQCVDMVVSLEVLEHLPHPERAITAYKHASRRYLLLSVPNEPIFRLTRFARGLDMGRLGDHPEHVQHWNLITFQNFVKQNDLRIISARSPFPFAWSIVLCQLP